MGGTYYFWSLFSSQVSVFVAVHVYNAHAEQPSSDVPKLSPELLWAGAVALAAAWSLTFAFFVFHVMEPRLRNTLWSWTSGRRYVQQSFVDQAGDDDVRFKIFKKNRLLWEKDMGEEVKKWCSENWAVWARDQPAWFKVENVPDTFIPDQFRAGYGFNRRRRGSAAMSIRESFRSVERDTGAEEDDAEDVEGGGGERMNGGGTTVGAVVQYIKEEKEEDMVVEDVEEIE